MFKKIPKNNGGYAFWTHKKKPTICAGTPAFCFGRAHTALSMNAVALLGIKAELNKLRHKGALTTEQFQLLKTRTKYGAVTESLLGVVNQAWTLRCDGTLDEG